MPWRGPEHPGEFPTIGYEVAAYIEAHCKIPDGDHQGEPFALTDEMLRFLLWFYRVVPETSRWFYERGGQLVRPQKWGKGPFASAVAIAEADGPVRFDGWDARGEPVGRPWATPWIQITAVSGDQTDNVWRALIPMIELGDLHADIPDTGETRINLPGGGRIEPVTSSARSRLGQRVTFSVQDETHSWLKRNGGLQLAHNQRRNLSGMKGRFLETTNAWDPNEESVAQMTNEAPVGVLVDFPPAVAGSFRNKRERRKVMVAGYGDSWWVDLDRIDLEVEALIQQGDIGQAERFFGNRVLPGADFAFDLDEWKALARPNATIEDGELVTVGFDGARRQDSTGIVVTDVETGLQLVAAVWERPPGEDDWEIPESEVDEAMEAVFQRWDVWRLYGDPPWWESTVDKWAGRWGEKRVVSWWTNRRRAMALALQAFHTSITTGELAHTGDPVYATHIGNARRLLHVGMVDDDGIALWTIKKDRPHSPNKIDLAMAGCLSWEARGDAIAAGAKKKRRRVVGW